MRRIFGVLVVVVAMVAALFGADPARAAAAQVRAASTTSTARNFVSLSPARLLDTRSGQGVAKGALRAGSTTALQVAGRVGVPTSGVAAVVLNVTATGPVASGWLTAWPAGAARPTASNLNFVAHQTVANQAIVKVGVGGAVDLYSSTGTQLFVDVSGYYPSTAAYTPLVPSRLMDTRHDSSHPTKGSTTAVTVTGRAGVPATGVSAVVLNVTAIPHAGSGWLTLFPAGVSRPDASILNYAPHQATAGMSIAKVGAGGRVEVYSSQSVDLLVDVVGWVPATSGYLAMTPVRIADTRNGTGGVEVGRVATGGVLSLAIAGAHGIPASGVNAVEINVTATGSTGSGYLTTYPNGVARPTASTLNYPIRGTSSNSATVKVGTDGRIDVFVSSAAYVFVDVVGYFTAPPAPGADAWTQGAADSANSGFNPAEHKLTIATAATMHTAWTADDFGTQGPVISGGLVYYVPFPGNTADATTLMVKNVVTGSTAWTLQLPLGVSYTAGAITDGKLLLPFQAAPDGAGLLAVDLSTHRVTWRTVLKGNGNYAGRVIAANGIAYLDDGSTFNAYRVSDGQALWSHADTASTAAASYAAVGALVYTLGGSNLIAYDAASGRREWSTPTAQYLISGPIIADGHVYLDEGTDIQAFNASGCGQSVCGPVWDTALPDYADNSFIGAAGNGTVFVTWVDKSGPSNWPSYMRSLSATSGKTNWTVPVGGVGEPPARAGNVVWLQVNDNQVQAYNAATGSRISTTDIPGANGYGQPIAIADGSVVIGADSAIVTLRAGG
ncbi:PQQ-binding-like beta-propeller repeat protein [Dermatophilaceae bacterium Sec6.4]